MQHLIQEYIRDCNKKIANRKYISTIFWKKHAYNYFHPFFETVWKPRNVLVIKRPFMIEFNSILRAKKK